MARVLTSCGNHALYCQIIIHPNQIYKRAAVDCYEDVEFVDKQLDLSCSYKSRP